MKQYFVCAVLSARTVLTVPCRVEPRPAPSPGHAPTKSSSMGGNLGKLLQQSSWDMDTGPGLR